MAVEFLGFILKGKLFFYSLITNCYSLKENQEFTLFVG